MTPCSQMISARQDDLIPFPYAGKTKGRSGSVVKFERLGGLLNYYHREKGEEARLAG